MRRRALGLLLGASSALALAQGCGTALGLADGDYALVDGGVKSADAAPEALAPAPPRDAGVLPPNAPETGGVGDALTPGDAALDVASADAPAPDAASLLGPADTGPPRDAAADVASADATSTSDASTTTATSCQASGNGLSSCGSDGESCCATVEVPGGSFNRTYQTGADGGAFGEDHPASVSTFWLDRYEITVGRFRQYVSHLVAGGAPPADGSGKHAHLNAGKGVVSDSGSYESGWDATNWNAYIPTGAGAASTWNANLACDPAYATWTPSSDGGNESLPINCLTWWQAYAFCIWDGGFLPTEAEWQYAAAGGSEQREYPWGNADPGTGNTYAIFGCNYPPGSGGCSGSKNIAPVGTATQGIGRWGQLDLAGSVWEWSLDWSSNGYVQPCVDCARLTGGDYRVFPGGSFLDLQMYLVASIPYAFDPPNQLDNIGARCARSHP